VTTRVPGKPTLRLSSTNPSNYAMATFTMTLQQTVAKRLFISGYSKADIVTGPSDPNYSIYVDVVFMDGTRAYGYNMPFSIGTHDWEYKCGRIAIAKPVKSVTYVIVLIIFIYLCIYLRFCKLFI